MRKNMGVALLPGASLREIEGELVILLPIGVVMSGQNVQTEGGNMLTYPEL